MKFFSTDFRKTCSVAFCTVFFFCIVLPLQSYMANASSFSFSYDKLLLESFFWLAFLFPLVSLILLFSIRVFKYWIHVFVLSLTLACILESGPLSIGLPVLNGHLEGYQSTLRSILDGLAFLIVMAIPCLLYTVVKRYIGWISVAMAFYSCAFLMDVKRANRLADGFEHDMGLGLIPRSEVIQNACFSPKRNVIVAILDAVSVDAAADVFHEDSLLREQFSGFVNFTNNIGMHDPTVVAIPGIMTGLYFESATEISHYANTQFSEKSVIKSYMSRNIPVYMNVGPHRKGFTNRFQRQVSQSHHGLFPSRLPMYGEYMFSVVDLSLFRCLPYFGKRFFLVKMTKTQSNPSTGSTIGQNIKDDSYLWPSLGTIPLVSDENCTFHIHHTQGGHLPICHAANGDFIQCEKPSYIDYKEQCKYSFYQVARFFEELKKRKLYDSATIVVMADHGEWFQKPGSSRLAPPPAYPFLMVHAPNDVGVYRESPLPTSHSHVAKLLQTLADHDLHAEDIQRILYQENRVFRMTENGKIIDWQINSSGTVTKTERLDREPKETELVVLATDCEYSLIPASDAPYPSFHSKNAIRSDTGGLAMSTNSLWLCFRCPHPQSRYYGDFEVAVNNGSDVSCDIILQSSLEQRRKISPPGKSTTFQIQNVPITTNDKGLAHIELIREFVGRTHCLLTKMSLSDSPAKTIRLVPTQDHYNWKIAAAELDPGVTYSFSADEVFVEHGETSSVEVILYEAENKQFCLQKQFSISTDNCSRNLKWRFTVPNRQGIYNLLVYAGIAGHCEGVGVVYHKVCVSKDSWNE